LEINSNSYIEAGNPLPKEKSFSSNISKKLPSLSIFPNADGSVCDSDSLNKVCTPILLFCFIAIEVVFLVSFSFSLKS
jgi:hypothetical protein